MILIYTVGIGSAGNHSDIAQGLSNSIAKMGEEPRRVILVPSASEDSVATAELIAEAHRESSEVTSAEARFHDVNDVVGCREVFRLVLRSAGEDLSRNERLVVNPTSGTKQMGIGAFLAAADEGVGEVTFVGGPRNEGTVITGSEKNHFFDATQLHRERAVRHAESLFAAGAPHAASLVLKAFKSNETVESLRKISQCMDHWQSLHFVEAAKLAAECKGLPPEVKTHLQSLRQAGPVSAIKSTEMLASARRLQHWGRNTDAMLRFCQTLEMAARERLRDGYGETSEGGLREILSIMKGLQDPVAEEWFGKDCAQLKKLVTRRNEYIHDGRAVPAEEVKTLAAGLTPFFRKLLPKERPERIQRLWPATLQECI